MKRKSLIASIMAIAVSLCLTVGATFALFTSESQIDVSVNSGKVAITATIDNIKTYTADILQPEGEFRNGGTLVCNEKAEIIVEKMLPDDKFEFTIKVENTSNVAVEYCVAWTRAGELSSGLVATADGEEIVGFVSDWTVWAAPNGSEIRTITVVVELPITAGNEYQDKSATMSFAVYAVQAGYSQYFNKAVANNVNAARTALLDATNDSDVILSEDIVIDNADLISKAYNNGSAVLSLPAGKVLDANGKVISTENYQKVDTYDAVVSAKGGTIKNATLTNSFRGLLAGKLEEDLYVENVTVKDVVYAFNTNDRVSGCSIYLKDSNFYGWTSYDYGHPLVQFTNCTFTQGTGAGEDYAYCRPIANTEFLGCEFTDGATVNFEIDVKALNVTANPSAQIIFENCTINGQPLTAELAVQEGLFEDITAVSEIPAYVVIR